MEKSLESRLKELRIFHVEPLTDEQIAELEANIDDCMRKLGRLDQDKVKLQNLLILAEQDHAASKAYLETVKIFLKCNSERTNTYKKIIDRV